MGAVLSYLSFREAVDVTEYDTDNFSRPRETLRELTKNELERLRGAAYNEILSWVSADPRDTANYIMEKIGNNVEDLLGWANAYHYDDEGAEMTLGFWPWKDDPIPANELGMSGDENV